MKLSPQGTLTIRTSVEEGNGVGMLGKCMKKLMAYCVAAMMALCLPAHAENLDELQDSYEQALGICATDSLSTGVGVSMMGWGLAIIVGITILAIVLHQSAGGTMHRDTSQGGTASSSTGSGIGSVI